MKNKINKKNYLLNSMAIATAISTLGISYANAFPQFDEHDLPMKYIVKFKDTAADAPSMMGLNPVWGAKLLQESVLERVNAKKVEKLGSKPLYSVEIEPQALANLQLNAEIEYVELDPPRFLLSESIPWGQGAINAAGLNDSNTGNRTICIIDSGYDLTHNDLSGNQVAGTNDSGTGSWSSPGNHNAHGTHVAGTIAAIANGDGVVGVMPNQNVNLHIVKVFNESGWGYSSSLVKAIDTCAQNGANVVNMSLGGSQSSRTERDALQELSDDGVLLIAAAGNAGNTTHSYPASYDSVMSIAAVDNQNHHAAFSQATDQVEVAAPGVAILSTVTVGEGVLSDIMINDQRYFDRGIVPHNRLTLDGTGNYQSSPVSGSYTGQLARCDISNNNYNCGDMTGKICLTERIENQRTGYRPEIDPVKACHNAGAQAAIIYSNAALSGLQNPFVLDGNNSYPIVSVSVDRALGLELSAMLEQDVTVSTTTGEDYQYYNGTSMATPHAVGVAGLVWSYHPQCSATQIRSALKASATDIDVVGRDDRTGYGLINATAANDYLDAGCDGPDGAKNYTNSTRVAIPDNSFFGVISNIDVKRTGDAGMVNIKLDIKHSYIGDLKVTLTSPTGAKVILHNNSGGSDRNLNTTYDVDFSGYESNGLWQLKLVDMDIRDTGSLESWGLNFQ